ncbi:MAG: M15 family metallopeptidase [Shewanellaceae bacterium]|nr:M15 family metallopeptidase [Shewanellaceae bacterium]
MLNFELTAHQILGLHDGHLVACQQHQLEQHTAQAFQAMQIAAKNDGITLDIASGYRSFDRQTFIWNQKAQGKRPVLDIHQQPIDTNCLTPDQLVFAILNWSALPGTSRHHLGSDLDIYDSSQIIAEDIQLIPEEYAPNGPSYRLYLWLKENAHLFHFYWPYATERGGVQIEPWHLSYAPVACQAIDDFPEDLLLETLTNKQIDLMPQIEENLSSILKKYVYNVDMPSFTS